MNRQASIPRKQAAPSRPSVPSFQEPKRARIWNNDMALDLGNGARMKRRAKGGPA